MIDDFDDKLLNEEDLKEFNNLCDECKSEDESVSQNLILTGFKLCKSCRLSKTIFPIQLIWLTGRKSILLITNEIDKKAIIRNDKKTTPKAFRFDFKLRICFVEIIKPAKIQN